MIIIIGTSHIATEITKLIKKTIEKEEPDCVAVELDAMRFIAMTTKKRGKPPGIFLKFLSWMQRELGKMTGITPGNEMIETVNFSRKKKIKTYLIDQNFSITARDIQKIPIKEKIKLVLSIFLSGFGSKKIDIKKVPSRKIVKEAVSYLKEKFPGIYKVLVLKRDIYMSSAVKEISKRHDKVLVVVGAGHIEGMKKLLKKEKIKIIG